MIEALAERRPPSSSDAIGLDTLVLVLIDQHITRLAEDGPSVRTLDTYPYRYDAGKLAKFIAGVRVDEATPTRIDAALRSMRNAHGPTMARRAWTLLRGALQVAVLNNTQVAELPDRTVTDINAE